MALFLFIYNLLKPNIIKMVATPTPEISPTPAAVLVGQDDWKTYTNTEFGFQMQYPKEFGVSDITGKEATPSSPAVLSKIAFTDSNKNQFTLNIYPVSGNPDVNTNVNNLEEKTGYCGSVSATRTLISRVFNENGLDYKQVAQVDKIGRNLADFCFFNPQGNPMVLRNNTDSTVIAMKHMISTLVFDSQ